MRAHVSARRSGSAVVPQWVEVGVIPVSSTGWHYSGRVSTDSLDAPLGRVELRGQAGATTLWQGALQSEATLVAMPVTLPGERLVFLAQTARRATFTLEVAWVEPGEVTPTREEEPCAR
ncbi:MAG: hypothetical protein R3F65_33225 [bacterium]